MRSFWYRLTRRPATLDDCLHYARANPPRCVTVTAEVNSFVREWYFVTQYLARFCWEFPGRRVDVDVVLSGHMTGRAVAADAKAGAALEAARRKLEGLLDRIAAAGVRVEQEQALPDTTPRPAGEALLTL